MRVGEFSVERRAVGIYIQARASMKQKVERETMNERVLTCTSGVYVCVLSLCVFNTCVITYMYSGWHTFVSSLSLEVARRFISCAANEPERCIEHCTVSVLIVHISRILCGSLPKKISGGSRTDSESFERVRSRAISSIKRCVFYVTPCFACASKCLYSSFVEATVLTRQ